MALFLEEFYNRTQSDDIGALLSQLILLEDGSTADLSAWYDWVECVEKVLSNSDISSGD